jgi:hypothetical protein
MVVASNARASNFATASDIFIMFSWNGKAGLRLSQ